MKKVLIALALSACFCGAASAASDGSSQKRAQSFKAGSFTLLQEWDDDESEYIEGSGVHYFKVSLKKGTPYSIWIEGGNATDMGFDVFTDWEADCCAWISPASDVSPYRLSSAREKILRDAGDFIKNTIG